MCIIICVFVLCVQNENDGMHRKQKIETNSQNYRGSQERKQNEWN